MMQQQLRSRLTAIGTRLRRLSLWRALTVCWTLGALASAGLLIAHLRGDSGARGATWVVVAVMLFVVFLIMLATWRIGRDMRSIARRIEAAFPDLNDQLLAATEQVISHHATERLGYLQQQVIAQTLEHDRTHKWDRIAPVGRLAATQVVHAAALATAAAIMLALALMPTPPSTSRGDTPTARTVSNPDQPAFKVTVEPGNATIERGTSLLVMARFEGPVPAGATLVATDSRDQKVGRLDLSRSLADPVFGGRIASVDADMTYHVEFAGGQSDSFSIKVFEYPQLLRADATLAYPAYTNLKPQTLEDTHHVSGVEGTEATWTFHLNKPVASAELVSDDGPTITLTADPADPSRMTASMTLDATREYRLHLTDSDGRANKQPPLIATDVFANRTPTIKLVFPKRDVEVSPIEELYVEGTIYDDFGVKAYGLTYSIAGKEPVTVTIGENAEGNVEHAAHQMIALEAIKAEPDQLLSYHLWADDVGPDGKLRRTFSDIYFAEVRPFEEIFREGQAPPGGQPQQQQQGNLQQIDEQIKNQKQIIAATWNLIRREIQPKPTAKFVDDAALLEESQAGVIEKMDELREKTQDAAALEIIDEAKGHMQRALSALHDAAAEQAPPKLTVALNPEQSAYQALLRLRAREHMVIRSQQSQQSGQQRASSQQRQAQLEQLKLDKQDNRYEQQSQAAQQQDPAQREMKQALNRLRELAQRQEDLNRQLKELEAALRQAKDEAEKQDIERRLKRLREEQRQALRDVDELKNRMEQPINQEQMADAREQVNQTRENVRRASEALEKGLVDKALTAGTRAEEQLKQLREQFRQKTAGQFDEAMRKLRDDARELVQKQDELGKQLEATNNPAQKSLRDTGERKQVAEGLQKQKQDVTKVLDQMRRVTEQAEQTEPLLSRQLYDTWRKAQQDQIDKALDVASRLLDNSLTGEAQQVERQARQGVNDLNKGIERAANSVLGDEVESLKRARDEVEQLARALDQEIALNNPSAPAVPDPSQARPRDSQQRAANSSQQADTQANTSADNNSERRASGGQQSPADTTQRSADNQSPRQGDPSNNSSQQSSNSERRGNDAPSGARSPQQGQQPGNSERRAGEQGQPGQQPASSQQGQPSQSQGDKPANPQQSGQSPSQQQGNSPQGQPQQQGQSPANQPGGQPGQSQNPGASPQQGDQPGQQGQPSQTPGSQPGQNPSGQQGTPQSSPSQSPSQGQAGQGQSPGQPNQSQQSQQPGQTGGQPSGQPSSSPRFFDQAQTGAGGSGPQGPITGEDFREWSDRLRDVEEMLEAPALREQVARVRDRAKQTRAEFKRHSKDPNWDLVRDSISAPLNELRERLDEEIAKRQSRDALVPIDRDPVPRRFADEVREYYERLGAGQ